MVSQRTVPGSNLTWATCFLDSVEAFILIIFFEFNMKSYIYHEIFNCAQNISLIRFFDSCDLLGIFYLDRLGSDFLKDFCHIFRHFFWTEFLKVLLTDFWTDFLRNFLKDFLTDFLDSFFGQTFWTDFLTYFLNYFPAQRDLFARSQFEENFLTCLSQTPPGSRKGDVFATVCFP